MAIEDIESPAGVREVGARSTQPGMAVPRKNEAPAWDGSLAGAFRFPAQRPGRGVIHPASLSEAGRNDPFLSTSKPLPPHSLSGLDRFRNAPVHCIAINGPLSEAVVARRIANHLNQLRVRSVWCGYLFRIKRFRFGSRFLLRNGIGSVWRSSIQSAIKNLRSAV
jgi:hypothetical protein